MAEQVQFEFNLTDKMSAPLKKINELLSKLNKASDTVDSQNFNKISSSLSSVGDAANSATNDLKSLGSTQIGSKIAQSTKQATVSLNNMESAAGSASSEIQSISSGSALPKLASSAKNAGNALEEMGNEAEEASNDLKEAESATDRLNKTLGTIKNAAVGLFAGLGVKEIVGNAISLSDQMTSTSSRLDLMNDGLQTTQELQLKIKDAANSSYSDYQTLADTVAKLGNNAGSAFDNTSQIVDFAEQLSKQFAISGASADEMAAATLQLTQGLSSGVLRGDEFNSVMEQAPGIAQMLADYLQVDKSKIRELASEGALTADVVKNAVLGASSETDQAFDKMSVTFGMLWTQFKNNALFAFKPISEALNNIANNSEFQETITNIGEGIEKLGTSAAPIIESIGNAFVTGFSWLVNNWQTITTGIGAILAVVMSFSTASTIVGTITKVQESLKGLTAVTANGQNVQGIAALGTKLLGLINPATLALTAVLALAGATAYFIATGKKVSDVQDMFSNFDTAVSNFATNFKSIIDSVVTNIQNNLPQIASKAGAIMSTLVTGLINSAVNLIGVGAQIGLQLLVGLAQAMPSIVSSGFNFITNFLSGLMAGIPQIIDTALTVIENFIGSLAENLPTLIQSGADTLMAWCQGIGQSLPTLIAQAAIMISGIVQTIGEHLPEIISKGFELISALVTGILQALPTIAQAALSLIINFGGYIIQNLPMILQAGINMVGGLVSGLINSIPALLAGVAQLLSAIMDGIAQAIPNIVMAAVDMGGQLVAGLQNGVATAWSGFWSWITEQFNSVITWVKSIFGIASPSTVFAEIGSNLLQGFWDGLKSIWEGLSGWIGGIWNQITSIFNGGGESSPEVVDFTEANAKLEEFKGKVQTTFAEISQQSMLVGQTIAANIAVGMGTLPAQIAVAFTAIIAAMQAQAATVVTATIQSFQALIPAIAGVFAVIAQQCVGLLSTFSASIQQVIMGIVQVFATSFATIAATTVAQFEIIKTMSISTIGSMVSSIIQQFVAFTSSILSTFTALSASLSAVMATIVMVFNTGWITIKTETVATLVAMSALVLTTIDKLVQSILTTVDKLRSEFNQLGRDMMTQLAAGITSTQSQVTSATSALVQTLKDTFEKGLGIHSPSDYMIWIGQMMLAGLLKGMSPSDINAFIESTINDMQTSFENGSFNAAETMDFLSQQGALDLIAKVTGMDLSMVENAAPTAVPAIIQEAMKYVGYHGSGGLNGSSMFGLHYGNPGAWCVSFVRYCAEQVGVPFPATNYVPDVTAWAQANGRWTMTPQPGYAAIFSNRHIELVAGVNGSTIDYIGGNTGNGEVKHRPRSDATGFVALDGGHAVGNTLAATLQQAYNAKYNPAALMGAIGEGSINWSPDAGVAQWTNIVQQALQLTGQPLSYTNDILYAIQRESSGNPNDTNNWDSNAAIGQNSRGLMQVIPDTFASYRDPNLSNNIYDPLANVVAAIRYILARYGSIPAMVNPRRASRSGWYGYAVGTRYVPQDMLAMIHEGEAIIPANQNPYSKSGGDYIADMFGGKFPVPDSSGDGGTYEYTITLNVTQQVNGDNAKSTATEVVQYITDELNRQFSANGGGVSAIY